MSLLDGVLLWDIRKHSTYITEIQNGNGYQIPIQGMIFCKHMFTN